jgi:transcription initiation factor IIE alpha subunit
MPMCVLLTYKQTLCSLTVKALRILRILYQWKGLFSYKRASHEKTVWASTVRYLAHARTHERAYGNVLEVHF